MTTHHYPYPPDVYSIEQDGRSHIPARAMPALPNPPAKTMSRTDLIALLMNIGVALRSTNHCLTTDMIDARFAEGFEGWRIDHTDEADAVDYLGRLFSSDTCPLCNHGKTHPLATPEKSTQSVQANPRKLVMGGEQFLHIFTPEQQEAILGLVYEHVLRGGAIASAVRK